MQIILGSSSPFRKNVFSKLVPDFVSMSPDIHEKSIRHKDPKELTLMIARAKADALLSKISSPSILVTADQVVLIDGEIREKPTSKEECRAFLQSYKNKPVEVINGVVVTNTATGKRSEGNDTVRLRFKDIPEEVIEQLIREGDVLHCAGGLKAEHPALQAYLASMEGTEESLQGVPLDLTRHLMSEVS